MVLCCQMYGPLLCLSYLLLVFPSSEGSLSVDWLPLTSEYDQEYFIPIYLELVVILLSFHLEGDH